MGFDLGVSPSKRRLVSLEQRPSQSSVSDPDEVQAFREEGGRTVRAETISLYGPPRPVRAKVLCRCSLRANVKRKLTHLWMLFKCVKMCVHLYPGRFHVETVQSQLG